MKRNVQKAQAWQQRSRQRLPAESNKRASQRSERGAVRAKVFERHDNTCMLLDLDVGHVCSGPLTPHHLRKASQGGAYSEDNMAPLCAGGNTWVEDAPFIAWKLGLVVRAGEENTLPKLLAFRQKKLSGQKF